MHKGSYCDFLHPPVSHEMDLPTTQETKKVVEELDKQLESLTPTAEKASPSIRVKLGKTTITAQTLTPAHLVFITRSPHPSEDLPAELEKTILSRLEQLKVSDVVLVDAHNCIERTADELPLENPEEIVEAVEKAIEKLKTTTPTQLEAGFAWKSLEPYGEEHGIGAGGITAIVLKTGEDSAALITYDANNMLKGMREKLLEHLEEEVKMAEVTTTDVHTTSALKPGEGYYPLGEAIPIEHLKQKTIEALKEAKQKLSPAKIAYKKVEAEVKVLGETVWKLTQLVDNAVKTAKKALSMLIITPIAISIITYLLL